MPPNIHSMPHEPSTAPTTTVPAGNWADSAWAWITSGTGTTTLTAVAAALLAATTVYAVMKRPGSKADLSRHLMYAPILLVNVAAIYGQVAFFYDTVAPSVWPVVGKIALALIVAAAIESMAVYVGWHAHDALLNRASATAARLRRASYGIAGIVAGINYAHFASDRLSPNTASVAFGLLSLMSPWLWGLHTRRAQHVQLTREGAIDATGATFSIERIRSFPIRAFLARRWSVDHYVTDPRQAWEGYNAELRARWADTAQHPNWWMRTNPYARVRQLVAAVNAGRVALTVTLLHSAELTADLTEARRQLAAGNDTGKEITARLDRLTGERDTLTEQLAESRARVTDLTAQLADVALTAKTLGEENDRLTEAHTAEVHRLTGEKADALRKAHAEFASKLAVARAEARVPNLSDRRGKATPAPTAGLTGKAVLTDEDAVQMMLTAHPDPSHEWSGNAVRTLTGVGPDRAKKLIPLWHTAALRGVTDERRAVNQ